MNFDIRFEVAATEWLNQYPGEYPKAGLDSLFVRPLGTFRRDYRPDILEHAPNDPVFSDKCRYDLSRQGLFDTLPEYLFHRQLRGRSRLEGEEMAEDVRERNREEEAARRFFLPIEQEFYRLRLYGEREERRSLLLPDGRGLNSALLHFWSIGADSCFSASQQARLLFLLPLAHRIVNDFPLTAACVGLILDEQVAIRLTPPPTVEASGCVGASLGLQVLGSDWIAGESFNDGIAGLELQIGPVAGSRLEAFLPGNVAHRALVRLFDFFLPLEADLKVTVTLCEEDRGFLIEEPGKPFLSKDESAGSRLGFGTFLPLTNQ